MIYHGHVEPLMIHLTGIIYRNDDPKDQVPFKRVIINKTQAGGRWPSAYTLLVFDDDIMETRNAYLKLFKVLRDCDHATDVAKHLSVATINSGDPNLDFCEFQTEGLSQYISSCIIKKCKIKVEILYFKGDLKNDLMDHFHEKLSAVIERNDADSMTYTMPEVSIHRIYKPRVYMKGITDLQEL